MKKLISILLTVILLFNFIICNNAYATDVDATFSAGSEDEPLTLEGDDLEKLLEEGVTNYDGETTQEAVNSHSGLFATIAGILTAIVNVFPAMIELAMSIVVKDTFSIEETVFGEFAVFDVNYLNNSGTYTIGTGKNQKSIPTDDTVDKLKLSVAKFYYIMRLFAVAISLLVLIYVGIRMAISTVASDQAKYKKMLMGWVESIIVLFLLQFIISILLGVGKIFENLVYDLRCFLETSGEISFEQDIYNNLMAWMNGKSGWNYAMYSLMFWVLVFIQTKFFLMYLKRLITVGFLVLIAPLITVTYPIDKIGDGKAQAFSVWLNELMMNIFIQPIHAMIYLVFMFTAGEIAKTSPFIALVFLLALTKIERIILQLFDLKKVTSLKPISEHRKELK